MLLPPTCDSRRARSALLAVLAVAAAVRLWHLETPSLWLDEALAALAAKLPWQAVLARVFESDIHPPTFHLLTKAFLAMGQSDFALRLPLAAAGVAGTWLCWRAGRELAGERTGLCMAGACAVLPWQVLLSRQLRPYAILFFFFLLGFVFLVRTVRSGRVRDAVLAGVSLWPAVLLHYGALLAVAGTGGVLLIGAAARRTRPRHVLAFAAAALPPVLAILPFLLGALGHERNLGGAPDRLALALLCLEKIGHLLFRENIAWARAALALLALVGLVRLWRRDRLLALVSLGWFCLPLAGLVAAAYGSYFNPWHLTFLTPVLLLWLGTALAAVPWLWAGAVACACALYFTEGERFYYREDSNGGQYKSQARELAVSGRPGTVFVYPQSSLTGPVNWYLDQFTDPNPLRAQRLGPEDAAVRLVVPGTDEPVRTLARTPVLPMGGLPFRAWITTAPEGFLTRVHALGDAACLPVVGDKLIATRAGRAGFAEFVFENAAPPPQAVTIHFGYANPKPGNRFAVLCRFDREPWAASFESAGPDGRGHEKLVVRRDRPYERLTVRFELERDGRSPAYTGEDLEAVRLSDFKVEVDPLARAPGRE